MADGSEGSLIEIISMEGGGEMDTNTAVELADQLIQGITVEINTIKAEVVDAIVMQIAIYAHDHIEADRPDFGTLSNDPSLDGMVHK